MTIFFCPSGSSILVSAHTPLSFPIQPFFKSLSSTAHRFFLQITTKKRQSLMKITYVFCWGNILHKYKKYPGSDLSYRTAWNRWEHIVQVELVRDVSPREEAGISRIRPGDILARSLSHRRLDTTSVPKKCHRKVKKSVSKNAPKIRRIRPAIYWLDDSHRRLNTKRLWFRLFIPWWVLYIWEPPRPDHMIVNFSRSKIN